ncbi:MAG TPA: SUMF1/EgtB/PvdO family nonheme iron enzyme [Thermodesulfovibrionia bacterium]|nr:SUMF1/EgtB/PvdO family nonheme iron enzyme [Thermodesulfovibrionia bacterium]
MNWFADNFWISMAVAACVLLLYHVVVHYIPARMLSQRIKRELPDLTHEEAVHYLSNYIRPLCQSVNPCDSNEANHSLPVQSDLRTTVDQWLASDTIHRILILLGEPGVGKTAFLINYLAYKHEHKYKPFGAVYIHLGFPGLRARLQAVSQPERTVLLLDGFNEDPEAIHDRIGRLNQIISWTSLFYRVIITCRTSFFPRDEEIPFELDVIKPGLSRIGAGPQYTFYTLYISPLNDRQIKAYITRRFPVWHKSMRKQALSLTEKEPYSVVNPLFLAYIENFIISGHVCYNRFQMYSTLIDTWVAQHSKKSGQIADALHTFVQQLAVELFTNRQERGRECIARAELEKSAVARNISLDRSWVYPSLIIQDESCYYRFAHRSVLEFLFAKALVDSDPQAIELPSSMWTDLVLEFLIQGIRILNKRPKGIPNFFVPIKGGVLQMTATQKSYEIRPFEMSAFLVTNSEYEVFDPDHAQLRDPSSSEDAQPVVHVSWVDAVRYCQWLSKKEGRHYRLPKESEWEFAASGGGVRIYPWGSESPDPEYANYEESGINKTTSVGSYPKGMTPEGLFDMAGNVWEWCEDWYNSKKDGRVIRGGAFFNNEDFLTCSFRARSLPLYRSSSLGFRLVRQR